MKTLLDVLGISVVEITPDHVELTMPISGDVLQEWGFLHGGATLALLESAASYGAAARTDPAVERPFGINLDVTHRKSGKLGGVVRGVADIDREEPSRHGGRKQFWRIVAYDEAGDVLSEGTMLTMISPLSRLVEKGIEAPEISYTGPCQDRPVVHGDGKEAARPVIPPGATASPRHPARCLKTIYASA